MTYEEALTLCRNSKRLTEKQSRQVHRVADKLLYDSKSSSDDIEKGISLYEAAAAAKDCNAEYYLAYYYGNGKKLDYKRSIEWYTRAAKHGDSWAMYNLWYAYHNGEGVEKNLKESLRWYRLAQRWCFELDYFELQKDIDDLKRQIKEQQ
jgi:TPR repeat protein